MAEALRRAAEDYFGPGGLRDMLVDEFRNTDEFVAGQRRGHQDAYEVLHGLADHVEEMSV